MRGPLQVWMGEESQEGTSLCSGVEFWNANPILQGVLYTKRQSIFM